MLTTTLLCHEIVELCLRHCHNMSNAECSAGKQLRSEWLTTWYNENQFDGTLALGQVATVAPDAPLEIGADVEEFTLR